MPGFDSGSADVSGSSRFRFFWAGVVNRAATVAAARSQRIGQEKINDEANSMHILPSQSDDKS